MSNRFALYFLCLLTGLLPGLLWSAQRKPFFLSSAAPKKVEANNRLIAVVNDQPITVYDLMKKLDLVFYKQFPQYAESAEAKYQFYQYNWKETLRDLIDKNLIMADAEEMKVTVSTGDIRQEIENLFGPNVIANLDRLGMSYEEAYEIVKSDMTIKRMMSARVGNKAQRRVTPLLIKQEYDEYAKEHIRKAEWDYRIISIRHKDPTRAAEIGNRAYTLLKEEKLEIDQLSERLTALGILDKESKFNISAPLHHNEGEVSEAYKAILSNLEASKEFSLPQLHKVRNSSDKIVRIFYLDDIVKGGPIPFAEVENKIISKIRGIAMREETEKYLVNLRKHFHVDEQEILASLPEDFEPFTLR